MGAPAPTAFIHEALFHQSGDELLDAVVPFVYAGFESGESAVLCFTPPGTAMLQRELGYDPRIAYLTHSDIYANSAGAIAAYQEIVDTYVSAGARRVRLVGETTFDSGQTDRMEWGRYEAVVNRAMTHYPVWAVCAYDTRRLDDDALALARLTHPTVLEGSTRTTSLDYVEPAEFLRLRPPVGPEALESKVPDLEINGLSDLDRFRFELEVMLLHKTRLAQPTADFILAANEVATNAIRYGKPPVIARLWIGPDEFICTVSDHGDGIPDPFAGYIWPGSRDDIPTGGMGLWLARRLCDRLDIFDGPDGPTVRLVVRNGHDAPHPRPSRHRHHGPDF
ncbi:MAG TPA: sensor histidine kinase [Nocardioidaceae bacterium]|nr:sensor histidine kinase [Nocardioidaceae bacterium]